MEVVMSEKKSTQTAPKICFERIIPDEFEPERPARHALRDFMIASAGRELNADEIVHVARMAVPVTKKWAPGTTLRCRFLDGSAKMKKKVEAVAHQWENHANIKFQFVKTGSAEIRISFFADDGSWSAVGRDALNTSYFPLYQPTMNYGWLRDNTLDIEYQRVVLHEFGHALGCIHEHQQPKFTRLWNRTKVLKVFQGSPNFWTPDDIEFNVLKKYSPNGIVATKFDPLSIMLYAFDATLFSDGLGPTNENDALSPTDISFIKSLYP
jgi:Astacin (Peptidase family M12A)